MSRLFWNEGGAYVLHAESPEPPVPALGRVTLEHAAPVPRQRDRDSGGVGGNGITRRNGATEFSLTRKGDLRSSVAPCLSVPSVPSATSDDQHRIAVAVEPVPPLHCLSIDGQDLVAARKRRREDQQRRLRQMEVGDQRGDQLEAVTRLDEQSRLTLARYHGPFSTRSDSSARVVVVPTAMIRRPSRAARVSASAAVSSIR